MGKKWERDGRGMGKNASIDCRTRIFFISIIFYFFTNKIVHF